jgi:hypothetical protein
MQNPMNKIKYLYKELQEIRQIPRTSINLMVETATDNPFYRDLTLEYYKEARQHHPKFLLIRQMEWGVALCILPEKFDDYFMLLEGAARRNYKKAKRLEYRFDELDYNNHLDEVTAIHHSTETRQGKLPKDFVEYAATPHNNPPSLDSEHAYPYFGVFDKEGTLVAYASCFIAGEYCNIQRIFGHADYQSDGCVPLLIISIAEYLYQHYPRVTHYAYGTWYGASQTMQRFKRKFHFLPHRVEWKLQSD